MWKPGRGTSLTLGLFVLAVALGPAGFQQPNPTRELAQEQLKLARQALQDLEKMHKSEGLSLDDPKFALWERRQVEAIRATGAGKAELIAALENYAKRMKQLETVVQTRFNNAEIDRVGLLDAQYRRLEAELWLNREKAQ